MALECDLAENEISTRDVELVTELLDGVQVTSLLFCLHLLFGSEVVVHLTLERQCRVPSSPLPVYYLFHPCWQP